MAMKMKVNMDENIAETSRYVCFQFFAFLIIAGVGMAGMYFADNYHHMITVGVAYLIVMSAIIVVIMADQLNDEVLKRLRGKK